MDSDSSMDEERSHVVPIPRPAMNENESDVSDEENISRAARSIESPPESPQGTHFESPPASPDPENKPGTPSPIQSPDDSASYGSPIRSPDSQTDSRLLTIESPPRLQGSYFAKTPPPIDNLPEVYGNDDIISYGPGDRISPRHGPGDRISSRYGPGDHISPTNRPHPYPSSPTSNHILGNISVEPEARSLIPHSPSSNQSPERPRSPHSPSPDQSPVRHRSPHSPSSDQSPLRPRSPRSPSSNESPRRPRSPQSPSSNESPGCPRSPQSPSSNQCLARNRSPQSPNPNQRPMRPCSPQSPSSNQFKVGLGSPQSLSSNQSPTPGNQYGIRSPCQRSQSPNSVRSPSPYRSRRRNDSPTERSRRQSSESPDQSQSSPRPSFSPRRNSARFLQSTGQQRCRRDSNNSDDGRSNISSASSFSSPRHSPAPRPRTPPQPSSSLRVKTVAELKSHVEDLSDVSDLDSLNSMSDEPEKPQKKENGDIKGQEIKKEKKDVSSLRNTSSGGLEADDTEQLDFEAEEKEEGECDVPSKAAAATEAVVSEDEGELKGDELEEGEITDEGENRPEETEPRPICRFYNRGQCTWGASCRFVHPGVTDKGNYTMFEMVRPLVPVNGPPPMYGPPMEPYRPIERPMMGPPIYQQPPQVRREEVAPVVESAWERGLRQAKEMLRKSSKRKETEVDFEEKKMNLSLGQDDLDKENDYYTRTASPILPEEPTWGGKMEGEPKRYRTMSDRFDDYGGGPEGVYYPRNTEQVWHQRPHYDESMRGVYSSRSSKYYSRESREKDYYSSGSKRSKYTQREVIVQRPEKTSWKDDSPPSRPSRYTEGRSSGGRGDEWADPWMRSKTSPLSRKQRSRKQSYSSGSSYSSSSSSRSSRSSSSSYSRSRSRSRSSRSRSRDKPAKTKMSPPRRLLRAVSPVIKGAKVPLSPALITEKKPTTERSIMMNPPPPSPRSKPKPLATNPSPPLDRVRPGVPARLLAHSKAASAVAAAMRSTRSGSKSSHSSSNSDSSGSSSDSSETSFSSSSSSRPASPPVRQKRIVIDERLALAQAMKVKAMDALKLSGQKQQIKLTLKGSGAGDRPAPMATIAGKKRPAESPVMDFSPPKTGGKTTPKKTAPSRREELLKQLKAVEDAIARKRSKIS